MYGSSLVVHFTVREIILNTTSVCWNVSSTLIDCLQLGKMNNDHNFAGVRTQLLHSSVKTGMTFCSIIYCGQRWKIICHNILHGYDQIQRSSLVLWCYKINAPFNSQLSMIRLSVKRTRHVFITTIACSCWCRGAWVQVQGFYYKETVDAHSKLCTMRTQVCEVCEYMHVVKYD